MDDEKVQNKIKIKAFIFSILSQFFANTRVPKKPHLPLKKRD